MPLFFVRRIDGLTYEFRRADTAPGGRPSYRRVDAELFCRRDPEFGWCIVDSEGLVSSRPFDDPGLGELPPEGVWVSRKGDASFVYDLRVGGE
jgi:hypothetical protein